MLKSLCRWSIDLCQPSAENDLLPLCGKAQRPWIWPKALWPRAKAKVRVRRRQQEYSKKASNRQESQTIVLLTMSDYAAICQQQDQYEKGQREHSRKDKIRTKESMWQSRPVKWAGLVCS
jgi:hypothetical protein